MCAVFSCAALYFRNISVCLLGYVKTWEYVVLLHVFLCVLCHTCTKANVWKTSNEVQQKYVSCCTGGQQEFVIATNLLYWSPIKFSTANAPLHWSRNMSWVLWSRAACANANQIVCKKQIWDSKGKTGNSTRRYAWRCKLSHGCKHSFINKEMGSHKGMGTLYLVYRKMHIVVLLAASHSARSTQQKSQSRCLRPSCWQEEVLQTLVIFQIHARLASYSTVPPTFINRTLHRLFNRCHFSSQIFQRVETLYSFHKCRNMSLCPPSVCVESSECNLCWNWFVCGYSGFLMLCHVTHVFFVTASKLHSINRSAQLFTAGITHAWALVMMCHLCTNHCM